MRKELLDLRQKMQEKNIDIYLIPTTDFHGSEYVNDYFKCREFLSGFTGSAGTLVVTEDWAGLWTDGRYFLQAAAELEGSGITLMKMGEPGVPAIEDYLTTLEAGKVLGFDGRVVDCSFAAKLEKHFRLRHDLDLVGEIWEHRPALAPSEIYPLPAEVTGESSASKLRRVRSAMEEKGADYHLLTKLEEIAWLYNLRGNDVEYTPVFYAFALITPTEDILYVMDDTLKGFNTKPYFDIFRDLSMLPKSRLLLDESTVSYSLIKAVPSSVSIINEADPAELMKALKNPAEIAATKNAHLKDGAAMVNFLYWLKKYVSREALTELDASDYLKQCRQEQEGCIDLSFETIAGYAENGAIIHYAATPETNKELKPEGFLLVDSGGQYEDGTTDITRTIALGPLTDTMKEHYTAVLRCHIQLAMAKFPQGTTGAQLDETARKPLRDMGLDFNHGTGHGVGHILSVHEGPNTISPRGKNALILESMITTDEPGLYLEGEYGIRLENELLCVENADNADLLAFEAITFCPFDREAVLAEQLLPEERQWLNNYHREVFEKISPLVGQAQAQWLAEATKEI